jgi:hypothetical protein
MEDAGYHGANANIQEKELQNQAEALNNLANAMSSDCQTRQLDKYSPNAHPRECNIESSY